MLDLAALTEEIPQALRDLDVEWPHAHTSGKVRESYSLPDQQRLIVTTDRLSAFDVVLAALPYKGQVLNQLSAFWFEKTADVVANHLLDVPRPGVQTAACRGHRPRLHHRIDQDRPLDALRRGQSRDLWVQVPGGVEEERPPAGADDHAHDQGRPR